MKRLNKRKAKIFVSYFLTLLMSLVVFCALMYYVSVARGEKAVIKTTAENVEQLAAGTDYMLSTFENMSFRIAASSTVNKILSEPTTSDILDYFELGKELNQYIFSQSIVYSIYVYFKYAYTVFTTSEGKIKSDEFFDQQVLGSVGGEGPFEGNFSDRTIMYNLASLTGEVDVFSVIRDIPIVKEHPTGRIVINLDADVLWTEMNKYVNPESTAFLISPDGVISIGPAEYRATENGVTEYGLGASALKSDKALSAMPVNGSLDENTSSDNPVSFLNVIKKTNKIAGSLVLARQGGKYFVSWANSRYLGWTYMTVAPYSILDNDIRELQRLVGRILVIGSLIVLVLSYFLADTMYSPFKKLMRVAGGYLQNIGSENATNSDAVQFISKTMEDLLSENYEVKSLLEKHAPIVKEKILSDILYANISWDQGLEEKLKYAGIRFEHDKFLPVIASVMQTLEREELEVPLELKIYAKSIVENQFALEKMNAYGTFQEEDTIAFVLNYKEKFGKGLLNEYLKRSCDKINDVLYKKAGIRLFFAFGFETDNVHEVSTSFLQAKKGLNYRAISDAKHMLFSSQDGTAPHYPINEHNRLVNGIKAGNTEIVQATIEGLFDDFIGNPTYSTEEVHRVVVLFFCSVYGDIVRDSDSMFDAHDEDIIGAIMECENPQVLKDRLVDSFLRVMNMKNRTVERLNSCHVYISKIVEYMEANFNSDISLADISSHVNLNPKYMAKIFKESTGETIFEHLNHYRINKSKELFNDIRLSIKDISKAVGYSDVHRFIKYFKKYEGLTPGTYRQDVLSAE